MILEEKIKFENILLPQLKTFPFNYVGNLETPDGTPMYVFTLGTDNYNNMRIKIIVSETKNIEVYIDAIDFKNNIMVLNHNFTFVNIKRFEYTIKKFAELVSVNHKLN